MAKQVYLNKREGKGKEIATIVVILLVVLTGALALFWLMSGDGESGGGSSGAPTALSPGMEGDGDLSASDKESEFAGDFFTLSTKDVKSLWAMIRDSNRVRSNRQYEAVINNSRLIYAVRDDRVNACSFFEDEQQVRNPRVVLFGGEARFERLIAYARAIDLESGTTNAVRMLVSKLTRKDMGFMPEARARQLYCECGFTNVLNEASFAKDAASGSKIVARRIKAQADKITSGIILGTLAHEAGHIALGHGHDSGLSKANLDVSRNQEREADSFGSSIMASSPYGSYMFESTLFSWLVIALKESGVESDHPLARERFENIVRSNKKLAQEIGIDLDSKGEDD